MHSPQFRLLRLPPRVQAVAAPQLPRSWHFGLPQYRIARSKWPFKYWLASAPYEHAWYIEDDVVFTGPWVNFFKPATVAAAGADIVAKTGTIKRSAWNYGNPLYNNAALLQGDTLRKMYGCIFRMSQRTAGALVQMATMLTGHEEALHLPLCERKISWCRWTNLLTPPNSVVELGGWGPWSSYVPVTDKNYALSTVASYKWIYAQRTWGLNYSQYQSNADVPRNALYHPVKCEANS